MTTSNIDPKQATSNIQYIRFIILLLGILCICASVFISRTIWTSTTDSVYNQFYEDSVALEYRLDNQLQNIVKIAVNNVKLAANSPLLPISVDTQDTEFLRQSWENMFNSSASLYQIRLLDLEGNEVYRMDKVGQAFVWTPAQQLQYKGDTEYFVEGISNRKAVYISALDLNKEQERVEKPIRPTIRAAAKFQYKRDLAGLVVLNYDLRKEFDFFKQQQNQLSHWIVKENGYFLSTPNEQEWGWLLNKPQAKVSSVFGGEFETQLNAGRLSQTIEKNLNVGQVTIGRDMQNVRLKEDNYWIITELPLAAQDQLLQTKTTLIIVTVLVILLIVLVAIYVDRLVIKMHEKEQAALNFAELAQQSERTKAKFLAQMSHEIRTPMNGVFGLLQLTYGERNQQKINDNLSTALRSFEALRRIIDDILDFSKIEADKLDLVSQEFALDIALREVSQSMSRAAYGKNIDMWIDIALDVPRKCIGDPIRLNQILFNLTNNAIKFTEEGEIRLSISLLEENDTHYRIGIELSDTGVGMTEQETLEIFNAFTQASDKTHGKFGGTSLGLAIVKQLVNLMKGDIRVISERAKGTSFELDVWLQKSSDTSRFSEPLVNVDSHNAEVFIVSESELARTILKKHCSSLGWLTHTFTDMSCLQSLPLSKNDNIDIMIFEHKDQLSEAHLLQMQDIKKSFPHLVIVHAGNPCPNNREIERKIEENKLLDVIIDKPITPSELYDNLVPYTQLSSEYNPAFESGNSDKLDKAHILLVEDNEINQMVAKSMLENAGAKVSIANNGQECLDMLLASNNTYSLILMDMQMPVMDGITATEEIRKIDVYQSLPIVALTANAMEEEVQACTDAGMQDHVAKPIDKSVLVQTVHKYL